jgi:hypothetical protein
VQKVSIRSTFWSSSWNWYEVIDLYTLPVYLASVTRVETISDCLVRIMSILVRGIVVGCWFVSGKLSCDGCILERGGGKHSTVILFRCN